MHDTVICKACSVHNYFHSISAKHVRFTTIFTPYLQCMFGSQLFSLHISNACWAVCLHFYWLIVTVWSSCANTLIPLLFSIQLLWRWRTWETAARQTWRFDHQFFVGKTSPEWLCCWTCRPEMYYDKLDLFELRWCMVYWCLVSTRKLGAC
jgi:hypothetical protein